MPLLLIPLLLLAVVVLLLALMPFGLWQRYRLGRARRRALPWLVRLNGWLLVASTVIFIAGASISSLWIDHALTFALPGLLLGAALGIIGITATRFERLADGLYYTPNRWLVLALTLLILARLALSAWQLIHTTPEDVAQTPLTLLLADHGNLFAVGGIVLGYALAYAWCLRTRVAAAGRPYRHR